MCPTPVAHEGGGGEGRGGGGGGDDGAQRHAPRPVQPAAPAPATTTARTRRSVLLASAAGPLEQLSLGTATWSDAAATRRNPAAKVPLSARIVPPSFATYLARFLLRYDD